MSPSGFSAESVTGPVTVLDWDILLEPESRSLLRVRREAHGRLVRRLLHHHRIIDGECGYPYVVVAPNSLPLTHLIAMRQRLNMAINAIRRTVNELVTSLDALPVVVPPVGGPGSSSGTAIVSPVEFEPSRLLIEQQIDGRRARIHDLQEELGVLRDSISRFLRFSSAPAAAVVKCFRRQVFTATTNPAGRREMIAEQREKLHEALRNGVIFPSCPRCDDHASAYDELSQGSVSGSSVGVYCDPAPPMTVSVGDVVLGVNANASSSSSSVPAAGAPGPSSRGLSVPQGVPAPPSRLRTSMLESSSDESADSSVILLGDWGEHPEQAVAATYEQFALPTGTEDPSGGIGRGTQTPNLPVISLPPGSVHQTAVVGVPPVVAQSVPAILPPTNATGRYIGGYATFVPALHVYQDGEMIAISNFGELMALAVANMPEAMRTTLTANAASQSRARGRPQRNVSPCGPNCFCLDCCERRQNAKRRRGPGDNE